MSERCEFAEKCPIVQFFGEQGQKIMIRRYCLGRFEKCARYQLRSNDQPVPEYTMPWDGIIELEANSK